MEILKKAWININDLQEQEKNMFLEHYKNNENVYILTTIDNKKVNIEYIITSIKENIINLQATGKVVL